MRKWMNYFQKQLFQNLKINLTQPKKHLEKLLNLSNRSEICGILTYTITIPFFPAPHSLENQQPYNYGSCGNKQLSCHWVRKSLKTCKISIPRELSVFDLSDDSMKISIFQNSLIPRSFVENNQ